MTTRVSKGLGENYTVGQSGNVAAFAEFEHLFPEVGEIASLLGVLVTEASSQHLECNLGVLFPSYKKKCML